MPVYSNAINSPMFTPRYPRNYLKANDSYSARRNSSDTLLCTQNRGIQNRCTKLISSEDQTIEKEKVSWRNKQYHRDTVTVFEKQEKKTEG